jgi:branched-chain amino acid transport system permease protein
VNPALYKTLAFGVSSFYAGVAGALLVIEVSFVNPDTFPVSLSILLLASCVIGGLGALSGTLFGALVIEFLPVYSESPPLVDAEFSTQAPSVVFGALLIVIVFLLPGGFAGLLRQLSRWATRAAGRMTARRTTPAPASDS